MNIRLPKTTRKASQSSSDQSSHLKFTRISLKDLCTGRAELYEAMSYFVLLDPERQLPLLGRTDAFYLKGKEEAGRGDLVMSRVSYDMAARIEICLGHKSEVRNYLTLADQVSESVVQHERYQELLANLEDVMRITRSFYEMNREQPETLPTKPEP